MKFTLFALIASTQALQLKQLATQSEQCGPEQIFDASYEECMDCPAGTRADHNLNACGSEEADPPAPISPEECGVNQIHDETVGCMDCPDGTEADTTLNACASI